MSIITITLILVAIATIFDIIYYTLSKKDQENLKSLLFTQYIFIFMALSLFLISPQSKDNLLKICYILFIATNISSLILNLNKAKQKEKQRKELEEKKKQQEQGYEEID